MPLNFEQKKTIVAEITEVASNAISAVTAEYRGLTVSQMTDLRAKAREADVFLKVVPNTLARRAIADTELSCLQDTVVGPIVWLFSKEDPGAAARVVRDFSKKHDLLKVKALSVSGQLLDASQLKAIADLPTRDQALATLLSVMKAPITKFVRTVREPHAKMVRAFAAVGEKKKAA